MNLNNLKSRRDEVVELSKILKEKTATLVADVLNSGLVDLEELEGYHINNDEVISDFDDLSDKEIGVNTDGMILSRSIVDFEQDELIDMLNYTLKKARRKKD